MNSDDVSFIEKLIHAKALELVQQARYHGIVVTIETKPREPFAMGNYEMVVETRLTKLAAAMRCFK